MTRVANPTCPDCLDLRRPCSDLCDDRLEVEEILLDWEMLPSDIRVEPRPCLSCDQLTADGGLYCDECSECWRCDR